MRKVYLTLAMTLLCASASAVPPVAVTPSKLTTFKDWTVGCDNGLACKAVALHRAKIQTSAELPLVILRGEGPTAPVVVRLGNGDTKSRRYRVTIDGKTVTNGPIQPDSDFVLIEGAEAMRLARMITRGRTLKLFDGSGADLGSASLFGASAALRRIDDLQGRTGSTGAIVATGKRRMTVKRSGIPVIEGRRIVPDDNLPDAGSLVALSEGSPCASERTGSTEDSAYSLGKGPKGAQALVLLNCGSGAYNASYGIYIGQRDAKGVWYFKPAAFDYPATGFTAESKIPLLVNADWNAATQSVSSFSKGRGLGDCGSSENYVWDGSMFRLSEASRMDECRGSIDWIPVWRAEVRLVS